ncbi:unnamed protein product [Gordionus sp. m RMFG-2023]
MSKLANLIVAMMLVICLSSLMVDSFPYFRPPPFYGGYPGFGNRFFGHGGWGPPGYGGWGGFGYGGWNPFFGGGVPFYG